MAYQIKGKVGPYDVDLTIADAQAPAPGPTPVPPPDITAWRGEVLYLVPRLISDDSTFNISYYKKFDIETLIPSWKGARVGLYSDGLQPCTVDQADISVVRVDPNISPGFYNLTDAMTGLPVSIEVLDQDMPQRPPFPMYMELQSDITRQAYWKATGSKDWGVQGPQTKKFIDMYRSFWIEPIKQAQSHYNLDSYAPYDYRSLVFDGAIAAPILWAGDIGSDPPSSFLTRVNNMGPAMVYCADEPGTIGMPLANAAARMSLVKQYAPQLAPFVTHDIDPILEPYSPVYCVVQNNFTKAPTARSFMQYASCMAQGNCAYTTNPNPRTTFPVMVIEGDPVKDWRGALWKAFNDGAAGFLYYAGTKNLVNCHEPGGLYNEGGNGDGTACYYDPQTGDPWPSVRMMHWHIALQEIAKVA